MVCVVCVWCVCCVCVVFECCLCCVCFVCLFVLCVVCVCCVCCMCGVFVCMCVVCVWCVCGVCVVCVFLCVCCVCVVCECCVCVLCVLCVCCVCGACVACVVCVCVVCVCERERETERGRDRLSNTQTHSHPRTDMQTPTRMRSWTGTVTQVHTGDTYPHTGTHRTLCERGSQPTGGRSRWGALWARRPHPGAAIGALPRSPRTCSPGFGNPDVLPFLPSIPSGVGVCEGFFLLPRPLFSGGPCRRAAGRPRVSLRERASLFCWDGAWSRVPTGPEAPGGWPPCVLCARSMDARAQGQRDGDRWVIGGKEGDALLAGAPPRAGGEKV